MSREPGLIFNWPPRHNLHLALTFMVIASVVVHAAGFVIFDIVYPRAAPPVAETAEVSFLLPGSRMAERAAPLLAGSDPALFSPGAAQASLPAVSFDGYAPGFNENTPGLKSWPAHIEGSCTNSAPDNTGPAPDLPSAAPVPSASAPPLNTVLLPSGELAGRSLLGPAKYSFEVPSGQDPAPAEFLIAVRPDGTIPYVFLQHGSHDANLDRQALACLGASRFTPLPSGKDLQWGRIVFHWGNDVKRMETPAAQ